MILMATEAAGSTLGAEILARSREILGQNTLLELGDDGKGPARAPVR
jgi:hypothetical protein